MIQEFDNLLTGGVDIRADYLRAAAYSYARLKGLSDDDAEDCAQECVVRVLKNQRAVLAGETPVRDLEGWLRGCARHCVIDHVRNIWTEQSRRVHPTAPHREEGHHIACEIADYTCLPSACLEQEECLRQLCLAIDQLRDTAHFYVLEHFFLNFSVQEIAEYHGETTNQVYKALTRALNDLRGLLLKEGLRPNDLLCAFDSPRPQIFLARGGEENLEKTSEPTAKTVRANRLMR